MTSIAHNSASCSLGFGSPLLHYKFLRPFHGSPKTRPCFQDSVHQKGRRMIIRAMSSRTVSAPKREKDPKKRVVITGMGLVSVFGNDVDVFYDKLLEGESGVGPIDRFDASGFSVRFAGQICDFDSEGYVSMKNDRRFDNYLKYCIVAGKKALENANL